MPGIWDDDDDDNENDDDDDDNDDDWYNRYSDSTFVGLRFDGRTPRLPN